ncbi:MAG TPA: hypothetical protein VF039_08130 [Longimicrobiales bacterium]
MRKFVCCSALLLTAALSACSLAGTGSPSGETGRARAIAYGMAALDEGDYALAANQLAPVAAICPVDELGARALLLLAAAELDGRNAESRPDAAAELAAFHLARSHPEDWAGAMAEQLYLIALDLGADPIPADAIPDAGVIWTRYLETADGGEPMGDEQESDTLAATEDGAAEDGAARAARRRTAAAIAADAEAGPRCRVPDVRDGFVMPELERTPLARRSAAAQPGQQPAAGLSSDVRALQAEVQRLRAELASREQELDRIRRTLRP